MKTFLSFILVLLSFGSYASCSKEQAVIALLGEWEVEGLSRRIEVSKKGEELEVKFCSKVTPRAFVSVKKDHRLKVSRGVRKECLSGIVRSLAEKKGELIFSIFNSKSLIYKCKEQKFMYRNVIAKKRHLLKKYLKATPRKSLSFYLP